MKLKVLYLKIGEIFYVESENRGTKVKNNKVLKIISSLCFILIILALTLINNEPTEGYEISIYTAVSPLVWVFLICSIVGGIIITVGHTFSKESTQSDWWLVGFFIIMMSYIIIFLLPVLRGYAFYGAGDPLSHVGYIKDIYQTGHIGSGNFYPATHIIVAITTMISDAPYLAIIKLTPTMFSFLYFLFIFFLCKDLMRVEKKVAITVVSCYIPLILGYYTLFSPNGLALLILPLILHLYFSKTTERSLEYAILLILFLLVLPFFHILVAFFLTFVFIVHYIVEFVYAKSCKNMEIIANPIPSINPILILLITTITWFSQSARWGGSAMRVSRWIRGEVVVKPINEATGMLEKANLSFAEFVLLIIKMYGGYIIFGIIAFIGVLFVLRGIKSIPKNDLFLCFLLISTSVLSLLLVFVIPTGMDPLRPLRFVAFPLQLFVGLTLYKLTGIGKRRIINFLVILLLLFPAVIGMFNVHYSPYIMRPNEQVTQMQFSGMSWFFGSKDPHVKHIGITSKHRFSDALLGRHVASERKDLPKHPINYYVGDHFSKLSHDILLNKKYMTLSMFDEVLYTKVWSSTKRFEESDFEKPETESSTNKIYSNGEFRIFFINPR